VGGKVEIREFRSRLLEGNPLGDDPVRRVPVYVPDGQGGGASRRFPVLYALSGFTGTGFSFLNYDWYQENLPARLDRLIESRAMPPAVVVMVDGMTRVGGNQFVDSSAVGPWARHVVEELVPWAEREYPLLRGREHRGVFGKSSGGYGALMMGIEHADVFSAVASHSGDCYFEYAYAVDFPAAADGLRSCGGLGAFLKSLRSHGKFPERLFKTLNAVAMAHFYSPNPSAPFGFDLPFDEATGERREDVLARWAERDPVNLVARNAYALRSLRLLWIECGTKDEWNLHHGARILSARLRALGIPHVHEEFEDDHKALGYRYDVTLPRLAKAVS
jgi:enterochelin esterase family protein